MLYFVNTCIVCFLDELDSYMFQTVGHHGIDLYAEAMGLPLYRHTIQGSSKSIDKDYTITENDEVEDLFQLLKKVKVMICKLNFNYKLRFMYWVKLQNDPSGYHIKEHHVIPGVIYLTGGVWCWCSICGSYFVRLSASEGRTCVREKSYLCIFFNFQNYMSHSSIGFLYMKKYVVSYIWWTSTCSILILFTGKYLVPSLHRCQRLGLTSLAYLWRRDQEELLKEMIDSQLTAVLIKVASLGENDINLDNSVTTLDGCL